MSDRFERRLRRKRVLRWFASLWRYGLWPGARRRRRVAEQDRYIQRDDEIKEAIVSVVTLLRGGSVSAADDAELVRARIRELKFDAFEANAVLDMVVGYSTISLEELQEHVLYHVEREERGRQ